jgi:long-chain acyl-CoA synthetase
MDETVADPGRSLKVPGKSRYGLHPDIHPSRTATLPTMTTARLSQPWDHLARWATVTPDAPLLLLPDARMTFAEVRRDATAIAAALRHAGLRPGDVVTLDLPVGLEVVFLAALLHEASVSARPLGSGPRADWAISSSAPAASAAPGQRTLRVDGAFLGSLPAPPPGFAPRAFPGPDALCRIAHSSGTTGTSKAVPLSGEMVHHRALAAYELWVPRTPFLSILGMGTASGFHTFVAALMTGNAYLPPGAPAHNLAQVTAHGVTSIKASPVQISLLLDEAQRAGTPLTTLRRIHSAGSVVPVRLRERVRAETRATLVNLLGSTEAGRAAERTLDDDDLAYAGDVVAGTELEAVGDDDRALPPGEVGRLRYRRAFQATEYLDDPQATRRAFRDGWFYPGDLGSVSPEGRVTLAGRSADLINAGGVKVNPAAVEGVAVGIDGVRDAVGFGYADGSGVTLLGLAVELDDGADLPAVAARLRDTLGAVAPTALFRVPELPRNPAGKVLRDRVAELYRDAVARAAAPQSP